MYMLGDNAPIFCVGPKNNPFTVDAVSAKLADTVVRAYEDESIDVATVYDAVADDNEYEDVTTYEAVPKKLAVMPPVTFNEPVITELSLDISPLFAIKTAMCNF